MKILGVDPAINITGYGLIEAEGNNLSLIDSGVISTKKINQLSKKLESIYNYLLRYVEIYKPSFVAVEKLYSHYRHPITAYSLGSARGLIYLICGKKNIPLVEYSSTRVKKAITGKGNVSKLQLRKMVEYLLGLENKPIKSFDISDALSLAITHAYIVRSKIRPTFTVNRLPFTLTVTAKQRSG